MQPSDPELLRNWHDRRDEPAFHELVARYAGLVRATALRTCGDDSIAGEAAQLTFILLARKAKSLGACGSLGGWLHRTAMMQTKNLQRQSRREQLKRDHLAMEIPAQSNADAWQDMRPVLDDALESLPAKDREALILRFYRSLSVREVAAALGIATDAAQKRIDRATDRLRDKLARRGFQAGGTLSATLLAGFAADAQAAMPMVPLLVSKSIGVAAVGTFSLPGLLALTVAAMKTTSLIPPALALIGAALWTGTKVHSLSAMEAENTRLRQRIDETRLVAARPATTPKKDPAADDNLPINWQRLATEPKGGPEYGRLQKRVGSMSRKEILAAFDQISRLELSKDRRVGLEALVAWPMVELDPGWLLNHFSDRLRDDHPQRLPLVYAFGIWATRDLSTAIAWFEERLAAGDFKSRSLRDMQSSSRAAFEAMLLDPMFATNPDTAAQRLGALTEEQKLKVMDQYRSIQFSKALENREHLAAFANLVRSQFTEDQRLQIFFDSAPYSRGVEDYPVLSLYLDKIGSIHEESVYCTERFGGTCINRISQLRKVDAQDIDTMREWFRKLSPDEVETMTGRALSNAMLNRVTSMRLAHASEIALGVMERTGSDEALATLLETAKLDRSELEPALALADRISNASRRANLVKHLESLKAP